MNLTRWLLSPLFFASIPVLALHKDLEEKQPAPSIFSDMAQDVLDAAATASNQPILAQLKAILLVADPLSEVDQTQGVHSIGVDIPNGIAALEQRLTPLFIDQPLSQHSLIQLKREILLYYRQAQRPIVAVEIPPQDITDGVLQIVIVEGKLGEVVCRGNKWFSDGLLKSNIHLMKNHSIDNAELQNDIAWLNRSPFRRTDVVMTPGAEQNQTNIELITKDRLPFRVYAGGDNTGTLATGNARWFTGFNWGNVFGLDHRLSYQGTVSSNFHSSVSHTVNYLAPFPWHHALLMFGSYAEFDADLSKISSDFKKLSSDGSSWQVTTKYEIPLGSLYKRCQRGLSFGFAFKNTNNNLGVVDDDKQGIIAKTVNIGEFIAGFEWEGSNTTFDIEAFWSPCKMFRHQSTMRYRAFRPGANAFFAYCRAALFQHWTLPHGLALLNNLRLQFASKALLPSEQYGLGGYNTVRGYDEHAFNADNALNLTLELHSKKMKPSHLFHRYRLNDQLYFLLFVDYGFGTNYTREKGQGQTDYLLGIGPGLRYNIPPYLTARLDWGFKLHHPSFIRGAVSKVHVSVIFSY